jgi:predicted small lipoprotein YifL
MRSSAAAAALVAVLLAGCGESGPAAAPPAAVEAPACDGSLDGYRVKGRALRGDVDGDGAADRVTVRADRKRPRACRHVLVADVGDRSLTAPVKPLPWFGTDPRLLLLAEIDGRAGLEPVVTMSPAAVYRPGAVFTVHTRELVWMRLRPDNLFPLADEFPAGVDCAGEPGTIVVTTGDVGDPDSHYDVERTVYEVAGVRFERVRSERLKVEVGSEERVAPFRSCPH